MNKGSVFFFLTVCCFHSQWLEEAMRENEPESCFIFLVGTKSDLLVRMFNITYIYFADYHVLYFLLITNFLVVKPLEERQRTEKDAIRIATEMHAEFWSVSAKTGKAKSSHLPGLYGT